MRVDPSEPFFIPEAYDFDVEGKIDARIAAGLQAGDGQEDTERPVVATGITYGVQM